MKKISTLGPKCGIVWDKLSYIRPNQFLDYLTVIIKECWRPWKSIRGSENFEKWTTVAKKLKQERQIQLVGVGLFYKVSFNLLQPHKSSRPHPWFPALINQSLILNREDRGRSWRSLQSEKCLVHIAYCILWCSWTKTWTFVSKVFFC